jgi:hypothetical protein
MHITEDMVASKTPWKKTLLLRDFIHESLYNPVFGYFQQRDVVASVGGGTSDCGIGAGLDFNDMLGVGFTEAFQHDPNA